MLLQSTYELDLLEYQLSINELEVNRQYLASTANKIYRDVNSSYYDNASFQKIMDATKQINPYEKVHLMENPTIEAITGEAEGNL
jgi:uncharacterized protein (UPF0335 family)